MQMQLAATQTERDQLRAEVESLNQQMSNREMVMQEEPGDVAALHQSLVEEQQMSRLLQEELEVARSEKDAAIATLQKRMVAAEERFTALQSDMEAKSGQPNPLERHVEELESMLAAMQAERDALLSENTFLQQADVQRISAIADLREAIEEQNCSRQLLQEELERAKNERDMFVTSLQIPPMPVSRFSVTTDDMDMLESTQYVSNDLTCLSTDRSSVLSTDRTALGMDGSMETSGNAGSDYSTSAARRSRMSSHSEVHVPGASHRSEHRSCHEDVDDESF